MTRRALTALLALAAALALAAPAAQAAEPKASLPDIEDEVMCVSCNVALNVAESPQAYRQREFIRDLVEQGLTKEQIKDRLVAEYGSAVLAMPEDDGIGLAAYLVPVAAVLGLAAVALLVLPRWRRRARAAAAAAGTPAGAVPAGPAVTDEELRRLDEDLRRFDR
jgi:cytochrome c-type biogenesis protein CcmH/NrfF